MASSTWCCALGGRPISIYNAHLDHTTPTLRQEQMRLARDIVGVDPYPAIFGGDFNASPGSPTLRLALDPSHTDLEDPWPLVGEGDGLTVPNFAPRSRDRLPARRRPTGRPTVMATWQSAVSDHRGVVGTVPAAGAASLLMSQPGEPTRLRASVGAQRAVPRWSWWALVLLALNLRPAAVSVGPVLDGGPRRPRHERRVGGRC